MKKIYLSLFLALGWQHCVLCQDFNVEWYNNLYNSAENQIVNGNYCKAKDIYLELGKNSRLFTTEKINGLVSCLECDSSSLENIQFFIQSLFEIGAPVEYFETEFANYSYFSSDKWNVLKEEKPVFDRDNKYIKMVNEMIKIDQAGRGYDSIELMEWADFRVYMKLQGLFKETKGLLGPEELGFDYRPLGYSSNRLYNILLIHQIKSRPYIWGEKLPNMYFDGLLNARSFTNYYLLAKPCDKLELSCFPYPPTDVIRVSDSIFVCSGEMKDSINKNRDLFYLDSVEDQISKAFYRESTDKPFRIGRSIPMYNSAPNEDDSKLINDIKKRGFKKYSN